MLLIDPDPKKCGSKFFSALDILAAERGLTCLSAELCEAATIGMGASSGLLIGSSKTGGPKFSSSLAALAARRGLAFLSAGLSEAATIGMGAPSYPLCIGSTFGSILGKAFAGLTNSGFALEGYMMSRRGPSSSNFSSAADETNAVKSNAGNFFWP